MKIGALLSSVIVLGAYGIAVVAALMGYDLILQLPVLLLFAVLLLILIWVTVFVFIAMRGLMRSFAGGRASR
jgi:hypothetical protein